MDLYSGGGGLSRPQPAPPSTRSTMRRQADTGMGHRTPSLFTLFWRGEVYVQLPGARGKDGGLRCTRARPGRSVAAAAGGPCRLTARAKGPKRRKGGGLARGKVVEIERVGGVSQLRRVGPRRGNLQITNFNQIVDCKSIGSAPWGGGAGLTSRPVPPPSGRSLRFVSSGGGYPGGGGGGAGLKSRPATPPSRWVLPCPGGGPKEPGWASNSKRRGKTIGCKALPFKT